MTDCVPLTVVVALQPTGWPLCCWLPCHLAINATTRHVHWPTARTQSTTTSAACPVVLGIDPIAHTVLPTRTSTNALHGALSALARLQATPACTGTQKIVA
jgi:hypothetical protein